MEMTRPKKETSSPPIPPAVTVTYTVTFNSSGGSAVLSQTVTEGGTATRPTNPTRTVNNFDNYVFDNWYAETEMIAAFDFSTSIIKNTTLYARWNLVSKTGHDLFWIPAGTFTMGSPKDDPYEYAPETRHEVTLTKGFYMGKYLVTQAQYQAVTGTTIEEQLTLPPYSDLPDYGRGDNFPMYYVSWYEAIVFCNKLSMQEGLKPAYRINGSTNPAAWGDVPVPIESSFLNDEWDAVQIVAGSNGYRLPTEAQWEYACRAGTTTAFNWGTDNIDDRKANYDARKIYDCNLVAGKI
jgi:formylglycine-generating enzyme required for sulfatase activity